MVDGAIGAALEREHHEIDAGLEEFATALAAGRSAPAPLLKAVGALKRHIYIEEEMLFPSLRSAGLVAPVFVMLREHGEIWQALDALEGEVAAGAATNTMTDTCRDLAQRLESHNMKEENILYPRADAVVSEPVAHNLAAFLASGEMPAGWVCEGARA
jgi:hemerythrin-like domain-containing protein